MGDWTGIKWDCIVREATILVFLEMTTLETVVREKILKRSIPRRRALSLRFPWLKGVIVFGHRSLRNIYNSFNHKLARKRSDVYFKRVIARHQSLLIKKLGQTDLRLQRQKIVNLKIAIELLNGLIIPSQKFFSFWATVGKPTARRGFVDGMLISNGAVSEGLGGGLCQLSNLLFWMFLHAPVEIVERRHHSMDVFPDSGRVIPFGSGASVMYNFVDLRVRNISNAPLQIRLWLTPTHLKGQLVSTHPADRKYHALERNHCFVNHQNTYYRFNELWRQTLIGGKLEKEEIVTTNFAPVVYEVDDDYISKNKFKVLQM